MRREGKGTASSSADYAEKDKSRGRESEARGDLQSVDENQIRRTVAFIWLSSSLFMRQLTGEERRSDGQSAGDGRN